MAWLSLDGTFRGRLELPAHFLPANGELHGVRDNLGFEGLSFDPEGATLFVAAENALLQDGEAADLDRGSPTRILEIDAGSGIPRAEYLYPVERVPDEPVPASAFRSNGISEILALDANRLLVLERSFSVGVGNRVRLYLVDLSTAKNILGSDTLGNSGHLESLMVQKELVADLHDLGVDPDNIEGLTLGPALDDGRRLLVMVADNNFQPAEQANQVLLFAVTGVAAPKVEVPVAKIHEVQGAGHFSPLVGRCVSGVEGIVTAVLGSRSGQAFWFQDPDGDDDPRTSDGVFVTALEGTPVVEAGDLIRLDGRVEERAWRYELPVTRLVASGLEIIQSDRALPELVVIDSGDRPLPRGEVASRGFGITDPARFAADAFESLEGMRVRVNQPLVVGPTSRHGEAVVVANGGEASGPWTAMGGLRLTACNVHPQRIIIDDRLVPDPPNLSVGDSLSGEVTGILHYTFGNYKLLNTEVLPQVVPGGGGGERTGIAGDQTHLTIAAFNLENLWAGSEEEKFAGLAGIVANRLSSPDILAVQEVQDDTGPEDDGKVSAGLTLTRLVEAIAEAGGIRYDWRSIDPVNNADGGQPGANIRNAFLFNPDRVQFVDRGVCGAVRSAVATAGPALTCSPGLVDPRNPAFNAGADRRGGSRKPLAGEFLFDERRVFVVNLHLRSKGGDDPIFGRRQPRMTASTARRTPQAEVVAGFVEELLRLDANARVVVLGDLNDFENTRPLRALEAAGLEDLILRAPGEDRYTYVYTGLSQVLDHVLVSAALAEGAEVDAVHVLSLIHI